MVDRTEGEVKSSSSSAAPNLPRRMTPVAESSVLHSPSSSGPRRSMRRRTDKTLTYGLTCKVEQGSGRPGMAQAYARHGPIGHGPV